MENTIQGFHLAVKENNEVKVQQYLLDGINPDEPNWENNGRPAILEAAYHGYVNIIKVLLNAGADPNAQNMLGETALHNAFHPKTFSKELVCLLIERGAEVNIKEKLNGHTPLHLAVKLCFSNNMSKTKRREILEILRLLCEKADPNVTNSRKETPMHRLVSGSADWSEPLLILIDSGMNLNAQNERGETALMCAIDKGNYSMAETLIKNGAGVNAKDKHLQTALHHSAQKNLLRLVILLLEVRCEVNATDLNGDTALHIAASKGQAEMVQVLVSHPGVEVNVHNIRGATPLLNAVESGFTRVVRILLEAYCDVDYEKSILTAMDKADEYFVRQWHPEIFSLLQEALEQKRDLWDEGETSL